jgi:hypothetical protein
MNKKLFFLGMLVMVLAFGMVVVGCEDETDRSVSPSFVFSVHANSWNTATPTTGEVKVRFSGDGGLDKDGNSRDFSVTPSDLSWVTVDKFELYFSGTGDRTVSITSVVLEPFNNTNIDAKLTLTRSAVPEGSATRTASVYLTIPSDFSSKYEVSWGNNKTFQF